MPWSTVVVQMHHANLEPFVCGVDFDEHDRHLEHLGQFFRQGEGEFNALMRTCIVGVCSLFVISDDRSYP